MSCGCGKHKTDFQCEQRLTIDYVPGQQCSLGVTFDGITDTLSLTQGVLNCESQTKFQFNPDRCRLEYMNEQYVSTNGEEGSIQVALIGDMMGCVNLEDLANVSDTEPLNNDLLIYRKNGNCGEGCQSIDDKWQAYTPPAVTTVANIGAFASDGSLVKLNDPSAPGGDPEGDDTTPYILVHRGNSVTWEKLSDVIGA